MGDKRYCMCLQNVPPDAISKYLIFKIFMGYAPRLPSICYQGVRICVLISIVSCQQYTLISALKIQHVFTWKAGKYLVSVYTHQQDLIQKIMVGGANQTELKRAQLCGVLCI